MTQLINRDTIFCSDLRPHRKLLRWLVTAGILLIAPSVTNAGVISVSNIDTDDIVIPMFDTNLGTLTGVELTVTLRSGSTNSVDGHNHSSFSVLSSNSRGNPFVSGFTASPDVTTSGGAHNHAVVTPTYAGGGLTIGTFAFSTNTEGSHNHGVSISYGGLQQVGPTSWMAIAQIATSANAASSSTYSSQEKVLNFSGAALTSFLGGSDIVIAADAITTNTSGLHSHIVDEFSRTVNSSTGLWTWDFESSFTPSAGSHELVLDPRFDTTATFTFSEAALVPEPSSVALVGIGTVGLLTVRHRRRRWKAAC